MLCLRCLIIVGTTSPDPRHCNEQVSRHSAVNAETIGGAEAHLVSSETEQRNLWMEMQHNRRNL